MRGLPRLGRRGVEINLAAFVLNRQRQRGAVEDTKIWRPVIYGRFAHQRGRGRVLLGEQCERRQIDRRRGD